ncbi:hypothetical protein P280DRAFT_92272 [Massarina eburnea CBS 473.64]|uniref:Uncharacterized protein n=1 Tax=Massarina eburnea CBS 473.64 TaxID=1395130 RepID=A0A6A6RTX0_9PLEO|nr:hypothetical protein P280DRAFT_92272 [Massarina eburnea CBS 473.64]
MVGLHGVLISLSYAPTGFVSYACSYSSNIASHLAPHIIYGYVLLVIFATMAACPRPRRRTMAHYILQSVSTPTRTTPRTATRKQNSSRCNSRLL